MFRRVSPVGTQFVFIAVLAMLTGSCKQSMKDENNTSDPSGAWTQIFSRAESFDNIPKIKLPTDLASAMQRSLSEAISKGVSSSATTSRKAFFRRALVKTITQQGGIHPDQLHRIVATVVDDTAPPHCGGASCARVFGFDQDEVNKELDGFLSDFQKRKSSDNPQTSAIEKQVESSLSPIDRKSYFEKIKEVFPAFKTKSGSLSGTCIATPFMSFGLRGVDTIKNFRKTKIAAAGQIDFRRGGTQIFQGRTGSCHLHSLLEAINHSSYRDLRATRNIDRERLFLEIWAQNLGGDLEKAIGLELTSLEMISQARARFIMRETGSGNLNRRQAFDKFVTSSRMPIRFGGQGGFAESDMLYLRMYGAATKSASLPRLSTAELEELGEALAIARLRVLEMDTFADQVVSEDKKVAILRPALERIFAKANESRHVSRGQVKNELARFRYVRHDINAADPEDMTRILVKQLRATGPLPLESQYHATTLVGYIPSRKVFLIRDSDDPLARPYVEYSPEEFFAYARSYGSIEPR